jgi:hypothetical protein
MTIFWISMGIVDAILYRALDASITLFAFFFMNIPSIIHFQLPQYQKTRDVHDYISNKKAMKR